MYVYFQIDEDCDGYYEYNTATQIFYNTYSPSISTSNPVYVSFDILDNATSFCFSIQIYDDDSASADDILDYQTGSGTHDSWTEMNIDSSWGLSLSYDNINMGETKPVDFDMNIYIGYQ